jgi:hypothetical protein
MDLNKVMKWLKTSFVLVLLLICILVLSLYIQFPSMRSNFFAYLGIVPMGNKCSGTISVSISGLNKCTLEARIMTNGCTGNNYQIRENSCSGSILCQDNINYDSFQATCAWVVFSGNYKYVLCVNNRQINSANVVCR